MRFFEKKYNGASVQFYFGFLFVTMYAREFKEDNLSDIGDRIGEARIEDLAIMMHLAHRCACMNQRKPLEVETSDAMHFVIDTIGLKECWELVANGIKELLDFSDGEVVTTEKKK